MSSDSIFPNNSYSFHSARALTFPDGRLTPEGEELLKRKPDDISETLVAQNERIKELLVQVKKLEEENKAARERVGKLPL
jgi:hypothetical protein